MQTKDGYLMVGAAGEAIWARCAKALGHPEWCEDPRFATNQARMENRDALEAAMNALLTTKTTNDWVEVLEAAGVPCGPVYDYAQMFADPQVRHRGLVQYASDARSWAKCRTSAPRSGSATECGCVPSRRSSASTMPKSSPARGQRGGNGPTARLRRIVIPPRVLLPWLSAAGASTAHASPASETLTDSGRSRAHGCNH